MESPGASRIDFSLNLNCAVFLRREIELSLERFLNSALQWPDCVPTHLNCIAIDHTFYFIYPHSVRIPDKNSDEYGAVEDIGQSTVSNGRSQTINHSRV
jgi:hypothetical protein